MNKQCPVIISTGHCIFVDGHSGDHYAPTDNFDHSDEIRLRILRDNCAAKDAEIADLRSRLEKAESALDVIKVQRDAETGRWLAEIADIVSSGETPAEAIANVNVCVLATINHYKAALAEAEKRAGRGGISDSV